MGVRTKIALVFFGVTAIMVAQIIYLIHNLHYVEEMNRALTDIDFKALDLEKQLLRLADDQYNLDEKYMVRHDSDYLKAITNEGKNFKAKMAELKPLLQTDAERSLLSKIADTYSEYAATFLSPSELKALEKIGEKDNLEATKLSLNADLAADLKKLLEQSNAAIEDKIAFVAKRVKRAERVTEMISASAVLLSLILIVLIVRRLSSPLQKLEIGTRHIANGDFQHRIKAEGNDELAQLSRAFNFMTSRLGELDEMKKEFVSHVSHELKAPLAAIKEVNSLLMGGMMGEMNEKQQKLIRISQQNCWKLGTMINDLLDISKIDAGVMEYKFGNEDLVELVTNCIHETEPMFYEKHITLDVQIPQRQIVFPLDKIRINQVLSNLLSNAVKFTPEGGNISVKVEPVENAHAILPRRYDDLRSKFHENGKKYVLVSVEDTGIGIPDNELEKIFRKFYRVKEGAKVNTQGTGLGLTIARSIVEAHGGFIWAENANGKGSRFSFILPKGEGQP